MSKPFSKFLDRLAERFAALMAGSISSRVEGLHAAVQADQQSQLEDLARQYEAEGKTVIAEALRRRAARLTSADLVGEAVEIVERLTADPLRSTEPTRATPRADLPSLDFSSGLPATSKKRRKAIDCTDRPNDGGATS